MSRARSRREVVVAALAIVSALCLWRAASAPAAWQTFDVTPTDQLGYIPQVAISPEGDAVFSWEHRDSETSPGPDYAQARARSAGGAFGPTQIGRASCRERV